MSGHYKCVQLIASDMVRQSGIIASLEKDKDKTNALLKLMKQTLINEANRI